MYTSASAIGSSSSASIPAGAWLATPWTETVVVVVLPGGTVGSPREAAAPPALAAPKTLSWNLAWAFFFRRQVHHPDIASSKNNPPSKPQDIGFSRNSSTRLGSGGDPAFFSVGFR